MQIPVAGVVFYYAETETASEIVNNAKRKYTETSNRYARGIRCGARFNATVCFLNHSFILAPAPLFFNGLFWGAGCSSGADTFITLSFSAM